MTRSSAIDSSFITPSPVSKSGMRTQLDVARDEITELMNDLDDLTDTVNNFTDRLPAGTILAYAGNAEPTGYMFCYGQTLERSAYPDLFANIGTTYNDGSETSDQFGLPDLRGRVIVGRDNMGGTAASRITSGVSGLNGASLGAAGGSQILHQHTHAVTDPGHGHSVTDPGHTHPYIDTVNTGTDTANVNGTNAGGTEQTRSTSSATTGITVASNTTGITLANAGTGASQNVQPSLIINYIIKVNGLGTSGGGGGGGGGGAANDSIIWEYACSTETDPLAAGVVFRTRTRQAMGTISQVRASLNEASTSGAVEIDVKRNGTSLFSTTLTIDEGEKTSVTAAVPAVLSTTAYADDDEVEVEIIAEGTDAAGLKIAIIGGNS